MRLRARGWKPSRALLLRRMKRRSQKLARNEGSAPGIILDPEQVNRFIRILSLDKMFTRTRSMSSSFREMRMAL
jgi:hypothetical protein